MFIFPLGGASLTILRSRSTKGTLSYSILIAQWIHARFSSYLGIMQVESEQWRAEIGNFNRCLQYADIKPKLNLSIS